MLNKIYLKGVTLCDSAGSIGEDEFYELWRFIQGNFYFILFLFLFSHLFTRRYNDEIS